MGAPVTALPEPKAAAVARTMRKRAIGQGTVRAFDPNQMTRDELIRFCTSLMAEAQELRAYAKTKDDEVAAGFARAEANVAAWRQSQERWKADYAFYLTLTRETMDDLIEGYRQKTVHRRTLEQVADAIAELCTRHTNPADVPRGGIQSWLTRAKRIWEALDEGTLLDKERLR